MRVLVTGASGFVGNQLLPHLSREGFSVRAAVRDAVASRTGAAETVPMPDMSRPFDAGSLVAGCEAVVHLAGIAHSSKDIPEATYLAVNCEAARTLARAAREAGVRRFIYISSVRAQTGASARGIVTEQRLPDPSDAYGRSKLAGEQAVASVLKGSGTRFVILRPVLMYGPHPKGNMATLLKLARTPWPLPLGGLKGRRSVLGIANFCSATVHVLREPACAEGTFLVADGAPVTVAGIVAAFRQGLGKGPGILNMPLAGAQQALGLLGRRDLAGRLFGDLVVSIEALAATGWQAPVATVEGLSAVAEG